MIHSRLGVSISRTCGSHVWGDFGTSITSKSVFSTIGRRRASRNNQFWSRSDCARQRDGRVGGGVVFSFII